MRRIIGTLSAFVILFLVTACDTAITAPQEQNTTVDVNINEPEPCADVDQEGSNTDTDVVPCEGDEPTEEPDDEEVEAD